MNLLRNSLIGAILIVSMLLFSKWSNHQDTIISQEKLVEETISSEISQIPVLDSSQVTGMSATVDDAQSSNGDLPDLPQSGNEQTNVVLAPTTTALISVNTDTLELLIDPLGGDIVKTALHKYPAEQDKPDEPFVILNRTQSSTYVAQSGLIGQNGTDTAKGRPLFSSASSSYTLEENQDTIVVDLVTTQDQSTITKRFTFHRDSYLINITYLIDNKSDAPWTGALYGQIKRDSFVPSTGTFGMQPYVGAAITTVETNYKKLDFEDMAEEPLKITQPGGWVAMVQHYFVSAWVPSDSSTNTYSLRKSRGKDIYLMGFTSDLTTIAPYSQGTIDASFYVGPKILKRLENVSPHLDLTIDFSWLWFISKPLFLGLDFLHDIVGNWGVAIILLTLCIKVLFLYPSAMSYRSMAKMRKLQPLMADLKEQYGDDRQRMSSEVMKLYKREKVNPLGGCLPVLMQMPVFIALYWTLMESVELRHAPFIFWITDLSVKDPFFVLPVLMGISMFIQQKLNPVPPDPMQAKIMQMMPFVFSIMFIVFPAGLVLYWVTNNTLSIIQQYIITKQIEKQD